MQGQHTQSTPQNGDLPHAVARLLADDPIVATQAWQDLASTESLPTLEATARFLLAPAPQAIDGLGDRTLIQIPDGSPAAYGRLGAAVLAAWTDLSLRERWREDPEGMATSIGLPQHIARSVRVVDPAEARLPRPDAITIPLPSRGTAISRRDALRQLAATEFGWLLAGTPDGAAALGMVFPGTAPRRDAAAQPLRAWLAIWLRPRVLLAAGSLACLVAAIGLTLGVGGDGGLTGAALSPDATWRLPAAAFSLGLSFALFVFAARRR